LFRELVGGRARRQRSELEIPILDQLFRRPTLQNRVLFDQEVIIPVLRRPLRVPYAFRNGVLNLVKPQRFAIEENRATLVAMRLASEGQLLHSHDENGEHRKLIVVSAFESTATLTDLPNRIESVLSEFHVRVVQENEIDAFAAEVEQQAR
jgi:hypothetical protein